MFKTKLDELGEEQFQQEVTGQRDGSDRGRVTDVSATEEAEDNELNTVTERVWW